MKIRENPDKELTVTIAFQRNGDEIIARRLPNQFIDKLGKNVIVAYTGRVRAFADDPMKSLRIIPSNQWEMVEQRILSRGPSDATEEKRTQKASYLREFIAECCVVDGKLTIPSRLAQFAEIGSRADLTISKKGYFLRARRFSKNAEEQGASCLQEWFQEDDTWNGTQVWTGKLRRLVSDYSRTISGFLSDLTEAPPEILKRFHRGIQAGACLIATHDDAEAINAIYDLCPDLSREVLCADASPIVCAVRNNAYSALDALLENGVDIESCGSESNTTIGLALEFYMEKATSADMIWHLIDCHASVTSGDIFYAFFQIGELSFTEELVIRAFSAGGNADADPRQLLDGWDEVLNDPAAYREIASLLPQNRAHQIEEFRPFLEQCIEKVFEPESKGNSEVSDNENCRDALQDKLLAEATAIITYLSPEVDYFRSLLKYLSAQLVEGCPVQHVAYGLGTIVGASGSKSSVQFEDGVFELDLIDEIQRELAVIQDPECQKQLFFGREMLRRGPVAEAALQAAKERVELLSGARLPHALLAAMKPIEVRLQ